MDRELSNRVNYFLVSGSPATIKFLNTNALRMKEIRIANRSEWTDWWSLDNGGLNYKIKEQTHTRLVEIVTFAYGVGIGFSILSSTKEPINVDIRDWITPAIKEFIKDQWTY